MAWKPDYVTVVMLRDYLDITTPDDDEFLALWVTAASRNVDAFCGRQFGTVDTATGRMFRRPVWDRRDGRYVHVIDDLYDTDGLTVLDEAGDPVTDLEFEPLNAAADGVPYQRVSVPGCGPILATSGKWGWPAVPASIQTGLLLMAGRLNARRGAPFGVAGSPSDGSEIRLLAKLDPDMIQVLKAGFRRTWWAA